MKRKPSLLSLTLCVSLGLHGYFLFMLSFQQTLRPPTRSVPFNALSLFNFAVLEPAAPEPAALEPQAPATPPRQPEPLPEPPASVEPVETFVSMEAPPEDAPLESGAESPEDASDAADTPEAAALNRAYVRSNYEYIQRHIREKLVYPQQARQSGIQGVAELSFDIHTDVHVSTVRITVSSGSETLDASAVEAIYSAAPFRPPPRQARLVMPVAFRLR
jgi:protein TonB